MGSLPLSHSIYLRVLSSALATLPVGFGINAILNPVSALSWFELVPSATGKDRHLIDCLMVVYGARDIFMGLVTYAAAYYGDRRALGWIVLASAWIGFVDGAVCKFMVGQGEWNHWGYTPMLVAVGAVLLGAFDGSERARDTRRR